MRLTVNGAELEVDIQGDRDAPVLFANHGARSVEERERIAALIPGAELTVFETSGHWPALGWMACAQ